MILSVLLITPRAIFPGESAVGQKACVTVDPGLSTTHSFGTFISVFEGVSLVWKEIKKPTMALACTSCISLPISAFQFAHDRY